MKKELYIIGSLVGTTSFENVLKDYILYNNITLCNNTMNCIIFI